MSFPVEGIAVGRCYLADRRAYPQVWRIVMIFPDGRVEYKHRPLAPKAKQLWHKGMTTLKLFAFYVSREVPCDWTPEREG